MGNFVCKPLNPIIAFLLAGLYLILLAIDMKREEREGGKR